MIFPKNIVSETYPNSALYWILPPKFSGDLILSYGGYLKYSQTIFEPTYEDKEFNSYPHILIYGKTTILKSRFRVNNKIKLHEDFWLEGNRDITREQLMVVLQNVTKILIKASENVT